MEYPSSDAILIGNFGADNKGMPYLGDSFMGEGVIRAAETGEILFRRDASDTASRLPSPLGTWIAIDHGDGLISMYSRLDDKKKLRLPTTIEKNMVIAAAGNSGWAKETGFYFSLFDRKERQWVNPAMIVSHLPDTRAPLIQSVRLQSASNRSLDPSQIKAMSQGRYTVFVTVADFTALGEATLAPFRIICSLNGREVGAITLETFSARDGILWIYRNGLVPVKQVYAGMSVFELGDAVFTRGQSALEILTHDVNENIQSVVYNFAVE
jgi:murein DD-endopeptidase MepM/ murein hydrolase activator NlpD